RGRAQWRGLPSEARRGDPAVTGEGGAATVCCGFEEARLGNAFANNGDHEPFVSSRRGRPAHGEEDPGAVLSHRRRDAPGGCIGGTAVPRGQGAAQGPRPTKQADWDRGPRPESFAGGPSLSRR